MTSCPYLILLNDRWRRLLIIHIPHHAALPSFLSTKPNSGLIRTHCCARHPSRRSPIPSVDGRVVNSPIILPPSLPPVAPYTVHTNRATPRRFGAAFSGLEFELQYSVHVRQSLIGIVTFLCLLCKPQRRRSPKPKNQAFCHFGPCLGGIPCLLAFQRHLCRTRGLQGRALH